MGARRPSSSRSRRASCWPQCENPACESNGTVFQPFRIYCPDCLSKNAVIDMTDLAKKKAKVHTFMVCARSGAFNMLDKPIRFINIEFEGVSTILFSYLLLGEPQIGMRVLPVFKRANPTYTILDLSWVAGGYGSRKRCRRGSTSRGSSWARSQLVVLRRAVHHMMEGRPQYPGGSMFEEL